MTTRKARNFWILPHQKIGERDLIVEGSKVNGFIHVQEVLPEPTNAELYEMSQQANACELHFRQGFQAALKWMKGESE